MYEQDEKIGWQQTNRVALERIQFQQVMDVARLDNESETDRDLK